MDLEAKAQELIDFAKSHPGVKIHGRTNPWEWAEELEKNNGGCPCHCDDHCPCGAALDKINDTSLPPQKRCCCCTFFVSDDYLKHYADDGTRAWDGTKPNKTIIEAPKDNVTKVREVDPKVKERSLATANSIKAGFEQVQGGNFDDLITAMRLDEATSPEGCPCRGDADLLASHADYVRAACEVGDPVCEEEKQKLLKRMDQQYDENLSLAGMARETGTSTKQEPTKPKTEWQEFSQKMLNDPALEGLLQSQKMKIAGALYRGECTLEEAIAQYGGT
jgi:hypothetical protein